MRKYAFELVVLLMFGCVIVLQLTLIKKTRQVPSNYSEQIETLTKKLDSLKIEEKHYENQIINNRIVYNSYRDSILHFPDSILQRQVYRIVDRYFYLHENATKNDTTNGQ